MSIGKTFAAACAVILVGCGETQEGALIQDVGQAAGMRVVSITGFDEVAGEEVLVHVTAGVPVGEDAERVALDALAFNAPYAIPLRGEDRFAFTGLVWDELPVVSQFNGSDAPASVAGNQRTVWSDSQTLWHVSGTSFRFSDGGDTTRCPSLVAECRGSQTFDGNNDFAWVNIKDSNTLGVTWSGTSIDEYDMALDGPGWNWFSGAEGSIPADGVDMETIAGHEFGHAAGLGHSEDESALMFAFYSLGTTQRTLSADDAAGISALYPSGGGGDPECSTDTDCEDGDACTIDTCDGGTCQSVDDPACGGGGECGGNKATCSTDADCCSSNCRGGTCRGN